MKMKRMKKSNLVLKLIIIVVAVSLLVCSLEAVDSHIEHCDEEDCYHCAMIVNAQFIIQIILAIFILLIYKLFNDYLVSKMHIINSIFMHFSLVNQSVQFNE